MTLPTLPDVKWSYSALDDFKTCPRQHYLTRILKTHGEQKGKGAWDGDETHKAMQAYVEKGTEPPLGLRKLKNLADSVCKGALEVVTEAKLGLRRDLSLCEFFAKDVCARIIIDLLAVHRTTAIIIDYKTGSSQRETADQLRICSWLVFSRYPSVQTVLAIYAYVKFPNRGFRFDRGDWANSVNVILPWVEQYRIAVDTKNFPATPCWKCEKYCAVIECPHHGTKYRS